MMAVQAASAADAAPIVAAMESQPAEVDATPAAETEATSEIVAMATTPEATETLVELADEIGPEAIPADTEPAAMEVAEPAPVVAEAPAESAEAEMVVVTAERPQAAGEE